MARNMIIGNNGEIPWPLSEDLKRFKNMTSDFPLIMGRKTRDSIIKRNGQLLPNRPNIVLTKNKKLTNLSNGGIEIQCVNWDDAVYQASRFSERGFVIGGEQIYHIAINSLYVNRMEITRLNRDYQGDTYFPEIDGRIWDEVNRDVHENFDFATYVRKND